MKAIVIGAGIVGSATAYELTRAGVAVTLIDRGPVAELGASRWGFGGVSWASAATPATIAFADRGFARYLGMEDELGGPFGLRTGETFVLLEDGAAVVRAEQLVRGFGARGHEGRLLTPAQVAVLEPGMRLDGWAGAMALQQAHLDLRTCARAWVARAVQDGMEFIEGVEVQALEGHGSRLSTSAGPMQADMLFVVTGPWTRPLLRTAGIELPVFHSHAEFLYSEPAPPVLAHQITWGAAARLTAESNAVAEPLLPAWQTASLQELSPASQELGLVQFADGHVRIGQISRMVPGYRDAPHPASFERLLAATRRLWPAVDTLPGLRLGMRQVAFSGDHMPLIGPLPGMPAAILVAPSASPTVMAPAIGEAMANYATMGTWDSFLDEWQPDRLIVAAPPAGAVSGRWAVA
jgi:glycine/D-amino acid oxidase-like deaminating enzyme